MVSGFPTGAYCSKASQTPMSFCAASSVSTCTRTREGMSSIVLLGYLVSNEVPLGVCQVIVQSFEKEKVGLKVLWEAVY
ncbi:hypothetical protein GCM10017771_07970 [Streptomyces capitiformicae]|uniref:Uncharacterized protein n=1 Tax=Streptomyces capitiformicae TaxID=2014920 RepID=A0A919GE62_9ACTN|nr:hypothetical protein GCM10017771_07970 [Streptomyces capitiformicae]